MTIDGYSPERRAACVAEFGQWAGQSCWKHPDDLERYGQIIETTRPDVIIETGTNTGDSARWFAQFDCVQLVITIDIDGRRWTGPPTTVQGKIQRFIADSVSGVGWVEKELTRHKWFERGDQPRVMASLDSDHSAAHVRREIELYGPLVSPGCHLVVEDGILAWLPWTTLEAHGCTYEGNPLDALETHADALSMAGWTRDAEIENLTGVTMHPAGWWRRGA